MTQTRIVLRENIKERAEELLEATQLSSLSELMAVLISRYGKHLEATWELDPRDNPYRSTKS